MINFNNFNGKKVLVCGLAKSGIAAAMFLSAKNAKVTAQDLRTDINIPNVTLYLGKNPDDIIQNFDLVVISPGVPFDLPFLEKARVLNIPVWGELELAYHFCAAPIIAITGTNGKTTVTTLVAEILQKYTQKAIIAGNIGIPFVEQVDTIFADNWVILEVSSFQLETIHKFAPKISTILNITPDHMDRHKTMEIYRRTKERIFENQTPIDFTVLPFDLFSQTETACSKIFFSTKQPLKTGVFLDGTNIIAKIPALKLDAVIADVTKTKILPENAVVAATLALCANVPQDIISETLYNFKGVPHRIEFVRTVNGVDFYNDSKATNTDAAIKGIEAMNRSTILIGGGYDKKADFNQWIQHFGDKIKHFIILGATSQQLVETCQANNYTKYSKVATLNEAVILACQKAKSGDSVLLSPACASWDMFDNFEQRGNIFCELVNGL
ncbi:MAG: UDP-N-acetylmuramoyl-L-alanine--D-glutamate ligase [Firmicutes bacterium]|nr:UDP-N-acetylmuramoyl-L-alanine--D-glutamate ligase [Bacillota bacterium]